MTVAGLFHWLEGLDRKLVERGDEALYRRLAERGDEALSSQSDLTLPRRARLMVVRQYSVFALVLIIVGAGLVGWVAFGSGPREVLFFALLLLGMGVVWLVPAVLFLSRPPRSRQVPWERSAKADRERDDPQGRP